MPDFSNPRILFERIQADDPDAQEYLDHKLRTEMRPRFIRHLRHRFDVDECLNDLSLQVWQAIKQDSIENPDCFWGFVVIVAMRLVAAKLKRRARDRRSTISLESTVREVRAHHAEPDTALLDIQNRKQIAKRTVPLLSALPEQKRELVKRFYLGEQPRRLVEREMKLTPTQFRNDKSTAVCFMRQQAQRPYPPPLRRAA